MAQFWTNLLFDCTLIDFFRDFGTSSDRYLDENIALEGVTYPAAMVLAFDNPERTRIYFLGSDLQTDFGEITGGTLTAMAVMQQDAGNGSWSVEMALVGFSLPAAEFYQSQLSLHVRDDQRHYATMMEGHDTIQLSDYSDCLRACDGNDSIYGGAGSDWIRGGRGDDLIAGDGGNDLLRGGMGADLFVFGARPGTDAIEDFTSGRDLIRIEAGPTGFDDLSFADDGADLVIDLGRGSIRLVGLASAALTEGDFIFS